MDKLHDFLCDLPGLLDDVDKILAWNAEEPGKEDFRAAFYSRALAILKALYSWRWDWEQRFPNSTSLISPADIDSERSQPQPPSPFKSIIWFFNPDRAAELMNYNAIRLIATKALETVGLQMNTPTTNIPVSDPLLPIEGTRHDVAIEICRMADYHLHSFRQSSGASMLIFPLNVAHLHLNDESGQIKRWLEAVLSVVADLHGFELGRRENMPRQIVAVSHTSREELQLQMGDCSEYNF